jgi:hypothetical protein
VQRLAEVVRRKHLALATESNCCAWLRRYCGFVGGLPVHLPSEHELERLLTVLTQEDVGDGLQNQAFIKFTSRVFNIKSIASKDMAGEGAGHHTRGARAPRNGMAHLKSVRRDAERGGRDARAPQTPAFRGFK